MSGVFGRDGVQGFEKGIGKQRVDQIRQSGDDGNLR